MSIGQILIIVFVIGLLAVVFIYREKIGKFVSEVAVELKKVSWPTRKELMDSTVLVMMSTACLGIYIGATDFVLSKLIQFIIQ